jgi:hypothetical protein
MHKPATQFIREMVFLLLFSYNVDGMSVFMVLLYITNIEFLGVRGKILDPFGYCLSLAFSLCLLQERDRLV